MANGVMVWKPLSQPEVGPHHWDIHARWGHGSQGWSRGHDTPPQETAPSDSSALVPGLGTQPVVLVLGDAAYFPRLWALY